MSRQRPGACRRRERRLRTAVDQLASAVQVIALFAESLRKSIHVSRADAAHLHGAVRKAMLVFERLKPAVR